jgi:RHS repeat-associated protein
LAIRTGTTEVLGSITKTGFLPPLVQSFSYDLDGNLTSDSVWDYQWDAENRLVRATTKASAAVAGVPNRELDFVYDYLGRRVEKRVYNKDSQTQILGRRYLYEGWNVIAEIENNVVIRSYTWGLDIAGSQTGAGGVGGLVQIFDHRTDKAYFPGYDGNGNVSVLIDAASGGIAAAYEYSPYGEQLRSEGTYAKENVYRFSTKEVDDETGLSYYGQRYYDPHNGRFICRDPIEESGGLNLYGFVGNNPICRWDLLGMSGNPGATGGSPETSVGNENDAERWKVIRTDDGNYAAVDKNGEVRISYDPSSGEVNQYNEKGTLTESRDIESYREWKYDIDSDKMTRVLRGRDTSNNIDSSNTEDVPRSRFVPFTRKDVDLTKYDKVGTLYVNDSAAYKSAKEGIIKQFPDAKAYFDKLENNTKEVILVVNNGYQNRFLSDQMIIHWDPTGIIASKNFESQPGVISLIHEVAHFYNYVTDEKGSLDRIGQGAGTYTNLEEKRIITGIERDVALAMGYSVRTTHKGDPDCFWYHAENMFNLKPGSL